MNLGGHHVRLYLLGGPVVGVVLRSSRVGVRGAHVWVDRGRLLRQPFLADVSTEGLA